MTTYDNQGRTAPKQNPSIIQVGLSMIFFFFFWIFLFSIPRWADIVQWLSK